MIYAFKRRRLLQICFVLFAIAILAWVAGFSWFIIPAEMWPLKWLFIILAGSMLFGAMPGMVIDVFSPGPILTISIEGIRYLPFSRETVPWSAVRSVTLTRAYSHARGSSDYYRFKLMDGVSFVVDDPKRFPVPPGGLRSDNIAISIMPTAVSAAPEAIIEAVRASWRGGDIREVDTAPPGATLH
ncbi:MAG: hypothetical protein ABL932_16790 [Terricaulis sp.]